MIENLQIGIFAAALAAAGFAILAYLSARRSAETAALSRQEAAALLRLEGDAIRAAADIGSRYLRQELGATLMQNHEYAVRTVVQLSDSLVQRVDAFGARLEAANNTTAIRIDGIGQKLNADIAQMGTSGVADRETLRNIIEQRLDATVAAQGEAARSLREELEASFLRMRGSVGDILRQDSEQQRERLDETRAQLKALAQTHQQAAEQLRLTVEGRLDAIRQENSAKLDEMRRTVDEKLQTTLEARLGESFNRVVEQLTRVYEGLGEMKTLAANVGDLRNVLTNVKVRGTFGEVQLERLIEDFLTPDQFMRNVQIKQNSGERVEFAIRCPIGDDGEETLLAIDAKFPREDYERLLEAGEGGDVKLVAHFRGQLHARIRACARDIRDKYIDPPRTQDHAILFLPTEGLYSEVAREPDLIHQLYRECNVLVAGPMNLAGVLNSFRMNFRSRALAQRSGEVWKVLSAVRTEFARYNDVVGKVSRQLQTASNTVENLGRRARAMDRTLRTVELLPEDGRAQKLLGLPDADPAEDDAPEFNGLPAEIVVAPGVAEESL
ncbi:MAG: DNA recombination protein RmuC [Burkholderiales bacterium]|nr:DNA recombination protein RmuC [Burkholderiales bacterium]